jgi:hypothetical protein
MSESTKTSKVCKICNIDKDLSEFYFHKGECKVCHNKKRRVNKTLEGTKMCVKCNEEKDIKRFRPVRNVCYDCSNQKQKEYMKEYYEQNKKEWKEKERLRNERKLKLQDEEEKNQECKDCKEQKNIKDFRLNRNRCKECEKKYNREWILHKKRNDPIFKFVSNCRNRLISAIGKNKKQSTTEYLGEDLDLIKKWFELCFTNDMTWENHGSCWHIDHVIPVSRFNLQTENDVIKCFNWKNLSPLTKKENLTKSNNIIQHQVEQHIEKLRQFTYKYYNNKTKEVETYITNIFLPYLTNDQ